ncbi:MAG: hypothetical protein M0P12_13810 [Paludibacteraceae bacterium]|nr:hypothetical protein [Paludibacteraceae bacterium]
MRLHCPLESSKDKNLKILFSERILSEYSFDAFHKVYLSKEFKDKYIGIPIEYRQDPFKKESNSDLLKESEEISQLKEKSEAEKEEIQRKYYEIMQKALKLADKRNDKNNNLVNQN